MRCRVRARPAQSHTEYANGSGRETVRLIFRPQRTDADAPRKAGSLIKEVGLMKFRFSARPLQARLRSRFGGINSPSRVRKGGRYPRAGWQMRRRAEQGGRDARQQPLRGAARLLGSRE